MNLSIWHPKVSLSTDTRCGGMFCWGLLLYFRRLCCMRLYLCFLRMVPTFSTEFVPFYRIWCGSGITSWFILSIGVCVIGFTGFLLMFLGRFRILLSWSHSLWRMVTDFARSARAIYMTAEVLGLSGIGTLFALTFLSFLLLLLCHGVFWSSGCLCSKGIRGI